MQQVSMKLVIKYRTCGSNQKKKTVQLVQVPPHFLSKDSRNAETKKNASP